MNSLEENALFAAHGWTKNLIARQWESPRGPVLPFDDVVAFTTQGPEAERELVQLVQRYGLRVALEGER